MANVRLPWVEPVPVIQQLQQSRLESVEHWIEGMRPRCAHFLPPLCIGLLDSGINLTHPAFSGASIVARSFIGNSDLRDELGEGTHHTGLLAAQPESGNAGLCPDAIIFAAKVFTPQQSFEQMEDAMYKALLWLVKVECPLVLMPQGSLRNSALVRRALTALMEQGAVILAGAGDLRNDFPLFPAAMRGVVAVSALDTNSLPLVTAYQGAGVDLLAPGENLISAGRQGWEQRSGSAIATVVAGGLLARALSGKVLRIN